MTDARSTSRAILVAAAITVPVIFGSAQSVSDAGAQGKPAPRADVAVIRSVTIEDDSYSRSSLTIHKFDKIKFVWGKPRHRHNVTSVSGPATFHSNTTSSDSYSYTHRFTKTGRYSLFCTQHPAQMQLSVKVKKSG